MAIRFLPEEIARKMAPESKVERLVTNKLTLNKAVLRNLSRSGIVSQKNLSTTALKVIKGYKKRFKGLRKEGQSIASSLEEALNEKRNMVQRVQNQVIFEASSQIKDTYHGEYYEWLPSDAMEPDPEHQLNYGKVFVIGEGEMPGERDGCRCGMNILVDETELELA